MIKQALAAAVERVLTPKRSTDVLREVLDAKRKGKTHYSFCGHQRRGKSTSLKVAYYLKEHNIDVMITACDTSIGRRRAIAIPREMPRCGVVRERVFKGSSRRRSGVLVHAKQAKKDCVLIDTAGRMQKTIIMWELAKCRV